MTAPTDLSRLAAGHRAGLLGRVVPGGPAPGDLGAVPRRGRARPATSGPSWVRRASCRRTPRSCATSWTAAGLQGVRRHGVRRAAQGQGGARTRPRRTSGGRRGCCARSAPSTWSTCPSSTPTCTPARPPSAPTSTRSSGSNLVAGTTSSAAVPARGVRRRSWCSTRTSTPTSTPRSGSSGSSPTPTRSYVNLCLDTGHIAYCDGDNIEIIERFPERITYVHLKQVDPEVRERVRREKLPLSEAVQLGVMVEPPYGEPDDAPAAGGARRSSTATLFA